MKLYIVGDVSDKENINTFCLQLKESAIDLIALFPVTDFMAKGLAVSSQLAVLWISSNTGDAIFNIANERNEKNLATINYFAGPVALSDSQKNAIGRNRSVFAQLNPNESIKDLVSILNKERKNSIDEDCVPNSRELSKKNTQESKVVNLSEKKTIELTTNNVTSDLLKNQAVHNGGDVENVSENLPEGTSPLKALLTIVGVFVVFYLIDISFDLRIDQIYPYILYTIGFFIDMTCVGGVIQYQEKNGKTFFSRFVVIIGWLSILFMATVFIVDLCTWIF